MVSRGNPLMGNGEKKDVDNPNPREQGSLLRRPESPKPLVAACPAGDCPGIPKTSRAGLAPTKTGKPQASRRSLPCRRLPGHSPPKSPQPGWPLPKGGESPERFVGACPAGDCPGIP